MRRLIRGTGTGKCSSKRLLRATSRSGSVSWRLGLLCWQLQSSMRRSAAGPMIPSKWAPILPKIHVLLPHPPMYPVEIP